jgi:hypothetical protein
MCSLNGVNAHKSQAFFRAFGDYPELEATGNTLFVDRGGHINGVAWAPDLDAS